MIGLKRVYETPEESDGMRVLVERLWPRGLKKEAAKVDLWVKEVAPSPELRKWYSHEVEKWEAFRERYLDELRANPEVEKLREAVRKNERVTFVYAARDEEHNSARVLREFLE